MLCTTISAFTRVFDALCQIGIAAHPSRRPLRDLLRMRSNSLKHNNLMLRSERRERLEAWAASDSLPDLGPRHDLAVSRVADDDGERPWRQHDLAFPFRETRLPEHHRSCRAATRSQRADQGALSPARKASCKIHAKVNFPRPIRIFGRAGD